MPEQLTLRLRKPGVILLTGDPPACEAVRAALEALKTGHPYLSCDVWVMPGASASLQQSVVEHGGEVWECSWDADDPLDPATIQVGEDRLITRPTWGEAALAALTDWEAGESGQQGVDTP